MIWLRLGGGLIESIQMWILGVSMLLLKYDRYVSINKFSSLMTGEVQ